MPAAPATAPSPLRISPWDLYYKQYIIVNTTSAGKQRVGTCESNLLPPVGMAGITGVWTQPLNSPHRLDPHASGIDMHAPQLPPSSRRRRLWYYGAAQADEIVRARKASALRMLPSGRRRMSPGCAVRMHTTARPAPARAHRCDQVALAMHRSCTESRCSIGNGTPASARLFRLVGAARPRPSRSRLPAAAQGLLPCMTLHERLRRPA